VSREFPQGGIPFSSARRDLGGSGPHIRAIGPLPNAQVLTLIRSPTWLSCRPSFPTR